jgi:alpha-L-fucosidase
MTQKAISMAMSLMTSRLQDDIRPCAHPGPHLSGVWLALGLLAVFAGPLLGVEATIGRGPKLEDMQPKESERDQRLGWWRQARFGLFIHWGVYSRLGGNWHGKPVLGYAEHIQRSQKISMEQYRTEVVGQFNPVNFDAHAWVKLAKDTGVGYVIITAKHHDGFAMYDSKVSDYNIVKSTPFGRDPMVELKKECEENGIRFGFYYSHAFDWGEKNAPGNDWDYNNPGGDRLLHGKSWWIEDHDFLLKAQSYVDEKAIPQIRELIDRYNPDIMWFDTPHKLPLEENLRILAAVRKQKPSMVINGRLVAGAGDYLNTADRPAEFSPQIGDWEGVPTTNESYGYNEFDHTHKTASHFIQLLVKAAARGGNILLNVGPRGDGTIDPADLDIFRGIGDWWRFNGKSIRGTTKSPLPVQAWGETTVQGNVVYLHVFHWPDNGRLVVGGLKSVVGRAYMLNNSNVDLKCEKEFDDVVVKLPSVNPDPTDSVVALECDSRIAVDNIRLLVTNCGPDFLRAFDANMSGGKFGPGKTRDAYVEQWSNENCEVQWAVRLNYGAVFKLEAIYDAPQASEEGLVEGDAGIEKAPRKTGSGGRYMVQVDEVQHEAEVKAGEWIKDDLGEIALSPGSHSIKVRSVIIRGSELFRLRGVKLTPVRGGQ